jgi:hypothetical protein
MHTEVAGSCTSNVLLAVQVADKNGTYYALGDTGSYTGGPGNIYQYDPVTTCWALLSGGPGSDVVVSISTDNSSRYYSLGGLGAYGVWATDYNDKIWAYCPSLGTCPTPPF